MSDILSALSILLVFLTVLLNLIETDVNRLLQSSKPTLSAERKSDLTSTRSLLFLKSLPIAIIFTSVAFTLIQKSYEIIITHSLSFWNIDILPTLFIFIELGLLGLTFYSLRQTFKLIQRLFE